MKHSLSLSLSLFRLASNLLFLPLSLLFLVRATSHVLYMTSLVSSARHSLSIFLCVLSQDNIICTLRDIILSLSISLIYLSLPLTKGASFVHLHLHGVLEHNQCSKKVLLVCRHKQRVYNFEECKGYLYTRGQCIIANARMQGNISLGKWCSMS